MRDKGPVIRMSGGYRILLTALMVMCSMAPFASAEDWYAVNGYKIKDPGGSEFKMGIVTRVKDGLTCESIVKSKQISGEGVKCVVADCVSGSQHDLSWKSIFDNEPIDRIYISLIDSHGYETRVTFSGATEDALLPIAINVARQLENEGGRNIRVIEPVTPDIPDSGPSMPAGPGTRTAGTTRVPAAEERPRAEPKEEALPAKDEDYNMSVSYDYYEEQSTPTSFSAGSTVEQVRLVQGEPTNVIGNVWFYGSDIVVFDPYGKVEDYADFSGNLKAD